MRRPNQDAPGLRPGMTTKGVVRMTGEGVCGKHTLPDLKVRGHSREEVRGLTCAGAMAM